MLQTQLSSKMAIFFACGNRSWLKKSDDSNWGSPSVKGIPLKGFLCPWWQCNSVIYLPSETAPSLPFALKAVLRLHWHIPETSLNSSVEKKAYKWREVFFLETTAAANKVILQLSEEDLPQEDENQHWKIFDKYKFCCNGNLKKNMQSNSHQARSGASPKISKAYFSVFP